MAINQDESVKIKDATTEQDLEKIWDMAKNVVEFRTSENVVDFWPLETLKRCLGAQDVEIKLAVAEDEAISWVSARYPQPVAG